MEQAEAKMYMLIREDGRPHVNAKACLPWMDPRDLNMLTYYVHKTSNAEQSDECAKEARYWGVLAFSVKHSWGRGECKLHRITVTEAGWKEWQRQEDIECR